MLFGGALLGHCGDSIFAVAVLHSALVCYLEVTLDSQTLLNGVDGKSDQDSLLTASLCVPVVPFPETGGPYDDPTCFGQLAVRRLGLLLKTI